MFTRLFEAKLNRILRTAGNETQTDIEIDVVSRMGVLPLDYLAWRSVSYGGFNLRSVIPDALREWYPQARAGRPRAFAISGRLITVAPGGGPLNLIYYRGVNGLSTDNPTNWFLADHTDAYVYGVLAEAFLFMRDEGRANDMLGRAASAIADLGSADGDARWGRSAMVLEGYTP